ncbi:outer membrane beta-barrel protein [Microvirga sp. ACRRW]|uniref:outer membrane protein n=1 Tax=Microvirga sp. ACRRW TaxID=2918205 RepID=UPI001EF47FAA|nr:outer membrane beta-barrel protein [Microvirga sp. ACRRW]MCG7393428.1 outer membrane beta-barrel protein [Microvirga sp. ACRRW]
MKILLLSASALVALTSLASAADLPSRAAIAVPATAPAFSWSGFYAGVHGAWVRDDSEAERAGLSGVASALIPIRAGLSDSSLGGGAQIGYLWQTGSLVVGVEADLTAMNLARTRTFETTNGAITLRTDLGSQMNLFGTVKGRAGVALPSLLPVFQQSLVYVTGGLAYAQIERQGRITVAPTGLGPEARQEDWTLGFVIGAGTEHTLTQNVSLKTEALYYSMADESLTLAREGDEAVYRFKNNGWISRIGLNIRF